MFGLDLDCYLLLLVAWCPWTARALPDYSCVCERYTLNACSRTHSCRLNASISFDSPVVPGWVTARERDLFANTVAEARNGLLRPPIFDLGQLTWESRFACDDNGTRRWLQSLSGCPATTNATGGNATATTTTTLHGWASLGFHPLGSRPGTWLTQILGQIDNPDGDPRMTNARCASTALYVDLAFINDTQPYDPRFSPAGFWGTLYRTQTYVMGSQGVPSYHTDQDLIAHGVDLNCTGYDQSGMPCQEPSCTQPPDIVHYDCPATNSGSVSGDQCQRVYHENSPAAARLGLSWALAVSLAVLYGLWLHV